MWFCMGRRLNQFFNLAVAPAMNVALREEAFGLVWAGKVEGDFVGRLCLQILFVSTILCNHIAYFVVVPFFVINCFVLHMLLSSFL